MNQFQIKREVLNTSRNGQTRRNDKIGQQTNGTVIS